MLPEEIKILKDIVDRDLPLLLQAEVQRLPVAYQDLVKGILPIISPLLVSAIDSQLAKLQDPPVAPAPAVPADEPAPAV